MINTLIFDKSRPGHEGHSLSRGDVPTQEITIPESYLREKECELPEVSEPEILRHYTRLSQLNYCVDTHFYPLGSCTMKYNPRVNEDMAALEGFKQLHPFAEAPQGALQVIFDLQESLKEIFGFDAFTLQPAAGAHGELTSLMMVKAYHLHNGEKRNTVLVPTTAHGTNPASANMCGFQVIEIGANEEGNINLEDLQNHLNSDVAAVMITNPNTMGLFEKNICKIADMVHSVGAILYGDGANSNALLGKVRPGDLGFDMMHVNLHKTFSTPHGGGGPGSGPVGVKSKFAPFLPKPWVIKENNQYQIQEDCPLSVGMVRSFYGNFGILVRALAYIRINGAQGLKSVTEQAVLSANYLKEILRKYWDLPVDRICMHEFVLSGANLASQNGVHTLDVAKRLLDYGFHAPTVYFPLTVKECMMIEPTETESLETLDQFAQALIAIHQEAMDNPELVKSAPHKTVVSRFDEVQAARNPILNYRQLKNAR